jgi:hypothetical protein
MTKGTLYPAIKFNPAHSETISSVLNQIDAFERNLGNARLNYRPEYQRGEAWDQDFKEKLVYSLVTNYPIGNFIYRYLNPTTPDEPTHEVVDGQQRILTIRELIRQGMIISPSISRTIINENRNFYEYDDVNNINNEGVKLYKKLVSNPKANVKLKFSTLPSIVQQQILNHNLNVVEVECDDHSIRQYFRFIQNQERLRAGEIINSIPDSPLRLYLDKIKKEDFVKIIGWKDSRKEFDKIFYSMVGVFDSKLNLGTTDKLIIDYVVNFKELSEEGIKSTNIMVDVINMVSNSNVQNESHLSKRNLKYFFLLAGYGLVPFNNENVVAYFNKIVRFDKLIPVFNSGTEKEIKDVFENLDAEEIENARKVFILGRGSHSAAKAKRTITILSNLIIKSKI